MYIMELHNQNIINTYPNDIWSHIQDFIPKDDQCSSPTAHLIHLRIFDLYNVWNINELTEQDFIDYEYTDFTNTIFSRRNNIF